MNEHFVQMGPMCIVGGLSAGWLADTFLHWRGYGPIADMGLGLVGSVVGGAALLAVAGGAPGMFAMFVLGFGLATGVILAQRFAWPCDPEARERRARHRLAELRGPSRAMVGPVARPAGIGDGRRGWPTPTRALARLATTGIYLLRGVPIDVQRAARIRASREATTLRQVLLKGLGEYAAGTWTPQPDAPLPVALDSRVHAPGR